MKPLTFRIILSLALVSVTAVPRHCIAQDPAAPAPSKVTPLELNALYGKPGLTADPDRATNVQTMTRPNSGVMEQWRDRMVNTLSTYVASRQQAPDEPANPYAAGTGPIDHSGDERVIMKIMAKETLKFAREHVPEIDAFVNSLKMEYSSERPSSGDIGREALPIVKNERKTEDTKTTHTESKATPAAEQDKLIYKTGIRVRVESGKVGLVSESEARYGKAAYFYKVNLDRQDNNSMGMSYALSTTASLQIEHDFSGTMNPASRDFPSTNVIKVGFNF